MAKNFDNDAYLQKWDGKIAGIMAVFIVLSIGLVVWLNKATKPDCTTHDYVYCGTELQGMEEAAGSDHGAAGAHGAAGGHGDDHGHDHGSEGHGAAGHK